MDFMKKFSIPMSQPDITDEEREAVAAVLRTNYLSMGPYVLEFESAFEKFIGCKHAIAVNSGTAGLHLCVRSAGWKDGDWVITTPFSFVSSTNALLFERITPVFVDVDPNTGNIDPEQVAAAVQDLSESKEKAKQWLPSKGFSSDGELKGILAVDIFGQPAAYEKINKSAKTYHLKVIEDSCEALGAMYKDQHAGRLADYGVFAFYPNKQITTGEGGIVITDCDEDAEMVRSLRNQGRAPGDTWLDHSFLGYNYRMDEMSAALGVVQMKRIHQLIQDREQVATWYKEDLSNMDGIECPKAEPTTTRNSWFVYVIRLQPGLDRSAISHRMTALGVPVRPYFSPIHLQPYMREKFGYVPGKYPVAEDLGRRGLAIPFSGKMTREQVQEVASVIRQSL